MFYKVVKRIFNRLFASKYSSKKRQRNPSSFQDCIDKPERSREAWKTIILVLLLIVTIYYMIYYMNRDDPNLEPFDESMVINEQNEGTDRVTGEIIITHKKFKENNTTQVVEPRTERPKRMFYLPPDGLPLCTTITVSKGNNETNSTMPKFPKTVNSIDSKAAMDLGIMMGGHYIPKDCNPRHKVAILVPFRNRKKNLNVFLYYMHPFLIRQKLEYRIFVIEQFGTSLFNKGRLFNAGFLEVQKQGEWQCVVFHDVDLLPSDDRIRYSCPVLPRHMCAAVVGKENITKYNTMFSGVMAMTMWHVKKTNGFSNLYKEKGESADMFKRLQASGVGVTRYKKEVAKYFLLKHPFRLENRRARDLLLSSATARYKTEGLSSLRYSIVSYASRALYTHIVVDINVLTLPDYITETSVTISP